MPKGVSDVQAAPPAAEGVVLQTTLAEVPVEAEAGSVELVDETTLEAEDITLRAGQPELLIEAKHSTWAMKTREAEFSGNVVATRGELVLRCDALKVKHEEKGAIQEAVASGNVRIESQQWKATGSKAVLDQTSGSLVLTGTPRLQEGSNALVGELIRVFLDDERVECEQCKLSIGAQ